MISVIIILIFTLFCKGSCELVQILEEIKNGTEIEELSKSLKSAILSQSTSFRIIEDDKLYHCLHIDPQTNNVIVKNRIDRESLCPLTDKCIVQLKFLISPSFQSFSRNIEIIDINDNPPTWPQRTKTVNFIEFEGNNLESRYIQIDKATDPDTNENSRISYFLKEKDGITDNKNFKIKFNMPSHRRIELSPVKVIDREKVDNYEMVLIAEDNGTPKLSSSLEIIVNVLDKNDNSPIFDKIQYRNDGLSETVPLGSVVLTVSAKDADAGNNGRITYRIDDSIASQYFFIDDNGRLLVKKNLDYDNGIKSFQFSVIATDGAPEEYKKVGECEVVITVKDENDEKPVIKIIVTKRDPLTNEPAIIENEVTPNFVLAHIQVKDADFGYTDRVSCNLNNNPKMRLEQIPSSENEFQIIAVSSFDREERSMEKVDISCVDQAQNMASKSIAFQILDLNDNSPKFTRIFHFRVTENFTNPNLYVGEIMAVDKDAESNSKIEFQIVGNEDQFFRIDSSGKLFTKKILDREEIERFNLTILATDGGIPPKTGTGLVIVDVTDINDWKPQFNSSLYQFSISESSAIGTIVGSVMATDKDLPDNTLMKYRIVQDSYSKFYPRLPFQITRNTQGEIVTKYLLDREEQNIYLLTIIAIDNGRPNSFTSTASIKVSILDVNDNPPIFRTNNLTSFHLQMTDSVGQEIGTVEASDLDSGENSEIEFRIEEGNRYKYFALNPRTGKLNLSNQLSKQGDHKLIIIACDRGEPKLCSRPLWIIIKVAKSISVSNPDIPSLDPISDSKTYVFIICVLVILLLIIIILIICAIIFKNRICYQLSQNSQNNSEINSVETNNKKLNSEIQRNGNGHGILPGEQMLISPQRSLIEHPNIDIQRRRRETSGEYQSIEGGSPQYKPIPQFCWDNASLQPPISDMHENMYSLHRSTKDYYYPVPSHQYPLPPIVPYGFQAGLSPSFIIRMNNVHKEPQFNQETFPRNQSPKRYNSLLNFQSLNPSIPDNYIYKSLRKEKNKASFV